MSNTDAMADLFDVRELYDEVVRTIQRYSSTHDMSESGLGPEAHVAWALAALALHGIHNVAEWAKDEADGIKQYLLANWPAPKLTVVKG